MASKKVQPIDIKLDIKGGEQLGKLSSAFRDLGKTVGQTDVGLEEARKSIIEYGKTANQSEALIRGQIKAFEGLQKQAKLGGKVFTQLESDIKSLGGVLYGASAAAEAKRKSLVDLGSSAKATTAQIQNAIKALTVLRNETRLDSEAFNAFGQSIERLAEKLEKAKQEAQDFANAQARSGRAISASSGAAKQQIKDLDLVTQALREQREELGRLEGEAKVRRGVADLAERGATSSSRRSYEQALAESVLSGKSLKDLLATKDIRAALAEVELQIAEFQKQVEIKLSRGLQISFQETSRAARESARAMAAAFADPELLGLLDRLDQRIGELPNTTAGFNQRLRELQQQLVNTARDSAAYVLASLKIAQVQREASAATQGLGAALVNDLASGAAVRDQKNLREAIGQLQAEMNELNTETAEGSSKYAENARQVNNLQKQLDGIAGSYRNVTDMARQASTAQGVYANTSVASNYLRRGIVRQQEAARAELGAAVRAGVASTQLALPAAGQTTAPGTGLERSGRAEPLIPEYRRGTAALKGYLGDTQAYSSVRQIGPELPPGFAEKLRRRNISEIESLRKLNEEKRVAKKVEEDLRAEVSKARIANNDSIDSVNRLRSALEKQRNTLPSSSKAFKDLSKEIRDLDRTSEKVSRRMSRRKFSPGKAAQVAGATISGGIFGGPEGFLGGAIGGAVGGVGGSFAGAALGAQVGQLRQALGGFADYAASIKRLRIALEGIAGTQGEYNRALAAAASVTKELNVPQETAIRGITRLTAAVKGAGGGVADAELAFKNITAAITATGGGAEQVEGAVTALVQIFSKGKVSAEEINQIAERLPGTFNKIAEASGRTGPELTKALQAGEVGLNDLMKFLVQLGGEYGELAEKIAGSSESAGARLTVAYNNMRIEIGKALQPVGAEFQEAFLEFITDIGPALVGTAKAVGEGLRFIIQNRNAIGTLASFAAKLVAVNFALKAFAALNGPLRLMFALIKTGFKQTTQQASLAAKKLNMFGTTAKALAASLVAPIVITFAIVGAELVISYFNRIKRAKADLDASGTKPQGEVFFRSIGGTAATKETLRSNFKDINKNIELLRQRIKKSEETLAKARETRGVDSAVTPGAGMAPVAGFALPEREDVTARLKADKAELARLELIFRTLIDKYPDAPETAKGLSGFADPTGTDAGGGNGKGSADQTLSRLISLQNEYDSILRSSPLLEIQRFQLVNSLALVRAQEDNNAELVNTIKNNEINLDFADQELRIRNQYIDAMNAAKSIEDSQERLLKERIAEGRQAFELEKLVISANGRKLALTQDTAIAAERVAKASEDELFNLRDQLGLVSNQERIDRFRQSRIDAGDPNAEQQADLFRQTIDPTLIEGLSQNIRSLKKDLEDLINPINQITGAANAIGSAFSQSFTDAISGSKSAKEALADFFKSVGSYFLDMAGQIIAKMVTMAILNAVVKVLPGGGGGPSGFNLSGGGSDVGSGSLPGINNLGGLFSGAMPLIGSGTNILGRASGGPVSANQPYIVGERGPELFVPFQQGNITSNEDLEAQMRDTRSADMAFSSSNSFQQLQTVSLPFTRNAEQSSIVAAERETAQAISNPAPLNVRFESQVINGVEYVTAEQHRQGMAQAAERGRSLTLSALQGSVKTRKKVGLS